MSTFGNASATSYTPFGLGSASMYGAGSASVGPMGVGAYSPGPMAITAANTVNRLGVASPFAAPYGPYNPLQPNYDLRSVNPLQVTPYDGFNGAAFGSFGPMPNPMSPMSGMSGSNFANTAMTGPMSATQQLTGVPSSYGGFVGGAQAYAPQSAPSYGYGAAAPDLMNYLSGGGFSPQRPAPQGYAPQGYAPQGYAPPPNYAPQGYAPQGYAPQQGGYGYGGGAKLSSPLGTYITSTGPLGGMANAGYLGAQAAGQGYAMVLNPINPGMVVDYANPYYSSSNFNTGFFAA